MISVQQKECPFTIQETTHALADALTGAVLRNSSSKNSSSKTIVAYRMGWMFVFCDASRSRGSAGAWISAKELRQMP